MYCLNGTSDDTCHFCDGFRNLKNLGKRLVGGVLVYYHKF